jgi:hypothetical protein
VTAALSIAANGKISSETFGPGNGGSVFVNVVGQLSVDGSDPTGFTGISSTAQMGSSGVAGNIAVNAGTLSTVGNGAVFSGTFGTGNAGNISVNVTGQLSINGISSTTLAGIGSDSEMGSTGNAGAVTVSAESLSIVNTEQISSNTLATGAGGSVSVMVAGRLSISGTPGPFSTGIFTDSKSSAPDSGDAGTVTVNAHDLVIAGSGGEISSDTSGFGKAGTVSVSVTTLSIADNGTISSDTSGPGNGGSVVVSVANQLSITGTPGGG